MLEKLEQALQWALTIPLYILGGLSAAIINVIRKKLTIAEAIAVATIALSSSVFVTPLVAHYFGVTDSKILGGIGYLIGLASNEILQLFIKLMDTLEEDPKFLINLIKSYFTKNK